MPRRSRQLSLSNIYHVMMRGNEKKKIFLDNEDRNQFVNTLKRMKGEGDSNFHIYAYCLMDNHVHLLLKEGNDDISRAMKRVSVSYAYYFNKKYQRVGHLFQDRFRSEVIENESYLLAAARYIHNNPVKAGIVKNAGAYKWSSYQFYIGKDNTGINLVNADFLLAMFSKDKKRAIKLFIEFTNEVAEDIFIDVDLSEAEQNAVMHDIELISIITEILNKNGQSIEGIKNCRNKKERDALIREIKDNVSVSVRKLSEILGVSKDIVFRA